jgi:diguanylate cyclase (GGDEF)-like protein
MPAPPAVTRTRKYLAASSMAVDKSTGARGDMIRQSAAGNAVSIEQEELRGISRTVAEIHWLLLILVLLYLIFGGAREDPESSAAVSAGLFFYAALVMGFRYANFSRRETRWKIAIETLGMVAFVTWVLYYTDGLASPLLNAYLLPVITSALTLGKMPTLGGVALIAACYLFLGGAGGPEEILTLPFLGGFVAQLAPVLLVAYITTMFSADIRYGLARAKVLSETDELTGLFNVRGFALAANRLFAQAVRHGRPTSVLMIDSDNLKTVNDGYGHEAGNELLRHLARAIQGELRFTDVSARYGGDEFIVLLPDTPPKGALEVAERIRARIAGSPLDLGTRRLASSVSIGIASFPEDGATLDALASHADRALYAAKQDGRNRTVKFRAAA